MCLPAIATGLQIYGTIAAQQEAEANAAAQRKAAIHQTNLSMQNYEIERQDAFDSSVNEITQTRLNTDRLNSQVAAAVHEDLSGGGRTADLIMRSVQNDSIRAITSIQDNYVRKSNGIDLNKESTLVGAKSRIDSIKAPSRTGMLAQIAGIGVGAYTSAMESKVTAESKGLDWNYWKGSSVKKK